MPRVAQAKLEEPLADILYNGHLSEATTAVWKPSYKAVNTNKKIRYCLVKEISAAKLW